MKRVVADWVAKQADNFFTPEAVIARIPDPTETTTRHAYGLLKGICIWIENRGYYPTPYELAQSKYYKKLQRAYPADWQVRYNQAQRFVLTTCSDLLDSNLLEYSDLRIRSLRPTLAGWKLVDREPVLGDNRKHTRVNANGNPQRRPIPFEVLEEIVAREVDKELKKRGARLA